MSERKIRRKEKKSGLNPIKKIGFSPISKTVLVLNALIFILIISTIKYVVLFFVTKKLKTNYSTHIKEAIKVWQGP